MSKDKTNLFYRIDPAKTYTTLYLVDSFRDTAIFMANPADSALAVQYNSKSTRTEFNELIGKLPELNRIGFVFDTYKLSTKKFLESEPYFTKEDLKQGQTNFSQNVKLLKELPERVKSIDFLCCNTLNNSDWVSYYKLLPQTIGASTDQTGNINGNWIMENINLDVKSIYFGSGISAYKGTLISSGFNFDTSSANPIDLDGDCILKQKDFDHLNVVGSNSKPSYFRAVKPIKIKLSGKISITQANQCIVIGSPDVKIYGSSHSSIIINVADIDGYPGLIMNGDANERNRTYNNIIVANIKVDGASTGLGYRGAWVAQANYGFGATGNKFIKCVNNAQVIGGTSGIVGAYSTCDIAFCKNNGDITVNNTFGTGGIIGLGAIDCNIYKCSNTGKINVIGSASNAYSNGGICGAASSSKFIKCSNTGTITVDGSSNKHAYSNGGICGDASNSKFIKCSNTGTINVTGSGATAYLNGGICGSASNSKFIKCSNTGKITVDGSSNKRVYYNGGICGDASNSKFIKCSNTGTINVTGSDSSSVNSNGGICGRAGSSKLIKCSNTGILNVTGSDSSIVDLNGGICGNAGSSKFIKCLNTGTLAVTGTPNVRFNGGICGRAPGSKLAKCINRGDLTCKGTASNNAGICGFAGNTIITNTINTGKITSESTSAGNAGFIGGGSEYSTITNSYNLGEISGNTTNAAFIADITNCSYMSIVNCYTTYGPIVDILIPGNVLIDLSGISYKVGKWNSHEAKKYLLDGWVKFDKKRKPWAIAP